MYNCILFMISVITLLPSRTLPTMNIKASGFDWLDLVADGSPRIIYDIVHQP